MRLFEQRIEQLAHAGHAHDDDAGDPTRCPTCHAPLPADSDDCEICTRELTTPPSTWVLLRLWRFARPYRWTLLAGFLLTLASTAATLVPPYLTIPLMDEVLIPFQNGKSIDTRQVGMLLGGLFGSGLLAWGLGWARTWLLALVSERIAADLRTTAFDHLLGLSLDYFGAKRTGDLIARIGSETDRLSVFLSLHALDFATDVLMLGMTAVILFSINPWLALVTLLPLPFIAWMIHLVRDRLRTGFEKIDRVWGDVTNVLADTIPGIRVVKAFAQEKREADRFADANLINLQANDKVNKTWSLFTPTVTLLTDAGPYADLIREAERMMAADARLLNVSVAGGFVFSDLPKCGITVTVTARDGDRQAAEAAAWTLAERGWAERHRHARRLLRGCLETPSI